MSLYRRREITFNRKFKTMGLSVNGSLPAWLQGAAYLTRDWDKKFNGCSKKALVGLIGQRGGWGSEHWEDGTVFKLSYLYPRPFWVSSVNETSPGGRSIYTQESSRCCSGNLLQLQGWQAMTAKNLKGAEGGSTGEEDLDYMPAHSEVRGCYYTKNSEGGPHSFSSANYRVSS